MDGMDGKNTIFTCSAGLECRIAAGAGSLVALIAPYSAYGRIVQNLLAPFYGWGNNLLAYLAERAESYTFYETEVWMRSLPTFNSHCYLYPVICLGMA